MEQKLYEKVVSCTPKKGIVEIDAKLKSQILSQREAEILSFSKISPRIEAYLDLGDICSYSGYAYSAIKMYRNALRLGTEIEYPTPGPQSQRAMEGLIREWKKYRPNSDYKEELRQMVSFNLWEYARFANFNYFE